MRSILLNRLFCLNNTKSIKPIKYLKKYLLVGSATIAAIKKSQNPWALTVFVGADSRNIGSIMKYFAI